MTHATLQMNGNKYVLVPQREYLRLTAEDRRDAALARRTIAKWRAGKLRTIPHAQLKRQLGL